MDYKIKEKNSAFLFIDVQEKLVQMLKPEIAEKITKNAEILAKAAKILGYKTFVTEQYPKGLGSTILPVKENLPENAQIFIKDTFDATDTDSVDDALCRADNIFIFGIETHICVLQTVLPLLKYHKVFVVKDACASRNSDDFEAGINLMEKEGARIITTEMLLFMLLKSSKHPNFKEVQALIK